MAEDGAQRKAGGRDRFGLSLDLRAVRLLAVAPDKERELLNDLARYHPYSARHSLRVAVLAEATALMLGFDADLIRRQAMLHDIGKRRIALAVLAAPRGLSSGEALLMREHAVYGDALLAAAGLDELRPGTRSHHERFTGGGYPDGLKGEEIPLAARLVSVCDVVEAMTAVERSWREPASLDEALTEIEIEAGSQFDPGLVEPLRAALTHLSRPSLSLSDASAVVPVTARVKAPSASL